MMEMKKEENIFQFCYLVYIIVSVQGLCFLPLASLHANFSSFARLFQLNSAVFFHTIFSIRLFILMPPSQYFRIYCSNLCAWWFCLRSFVVCCPSCLVKWTTFFSSSSSSSLCCSLLHLHSFVSFFFRYLFSH